MSRVQAPIKVQNVTTEVIQGECLATLWQMDSESYDAIITDPPYSSGGAFRSDRILNPNEKYVQGGTIIDRMSFTGDNRDGRSWAYWSTLWLGECLRLAKTGAYLLMFSDWRQLPLASDAIQAGGWVWRGLVPWDKTGAARAPHTGYFRHQCEYILWATKGPCYERPGEGPFPGVYKYPVLQSDKHHMTGKPTPLMRDLCKCVPKGGRVLDPFCGSGTTGVAAAQLGLSSTMIEYVDEYAQQSRDRIKAELEGVALVERTYGTSTRTLAGLPMFEMMEIGERRIT